MPSTSLVISVEVVAMPMVSASPLPVGAEDAEAEASAASWFVSEALSSELPHAVSESAAATSASAARTTRWWITVGPFTDPYVYLPP